MICVKKQTKGFFFTLTKGGQGFVWHVKMFKALVEIKNGELGKEGKEGGKVENECSSRNRLVGHRRHCERSDSSG